MQTHVALFGVLCVALVVDPAIGRAVFGGKRHRNHIKHDRRVNQGDSRPLGRGHWRGADYGNYRQYPNYYYGGLDENADYPDYGHYPEYYRGGLDESLQYYDFSDSKDSSSSDSDESKYDKPDKWVWFDFDDSSTQTEEDSSHSKSTDSFSTDSDESKYDKPSKWAWFDFDDSSTQTEEDSSHSKSTDSFSTDTDEQEDDYSDIWSWLDLFRSESSDDDVSDDDYFSFHVDIATETPEMEIMTDHPGVESGTTEYPYVEIMPHYTDVDGVREPNAVEPVTDYPAEISYYFGSEHDYDDDTTVTYDMAYDWETLGRDASRRKKWSVGGAIKAVGQKAIGNAIGYLTE